MTTPKTSASARELILAQVALEQAEFEAQDAAGMPPPRRGCRRSVGSPTLSVRLDPGELDALERRAAQIGIKPSVLARNLIRAGLARRSGVTLTAAVGRLEAAFDELRDLVPDAAQD